MAQIMASGKNVAKGGPNDNIVIAFWANVEGETVLDSGKKVPKFKAGWKANDEAKSKAREAFGKLNDAEKAEIRAMLKDDIDGFLAKKAAFKEFTASSASLGRRIYR